MDLSLEQTGQLIAALLMVFVLFSAALAVPARIAIAALIVLIPFQPIETQYGSANVVLTYALCGALILSGRTLRMPMLASLLAIILAYLLSTSQTHASTYVQHSIYIFLLFSSFVVFYLVYNFARELDDARFAVNVLIVSNLFVLLVCVLQVYSGLSERFSFFGFDELQLHRIRADERLSGPFGAAGVTAEYLMLMLFILSYDLMHAVGRRRIFVLALIAANLGTLLSTGNRGAFLTMIAMFPLYLYMFRNKLGTRKVVRIFVVAAVLLTGVSTVVIGYSDLGHMYERLARLTETQGFIPETRSVTWPTAWENIKDKPLIGHGPRLRLMDDAETAYEGHVVIPYPHSLYLYLLFTVGVVGTTMFLAFLGRLGWQVLTAARAVGSSTYRAGFVRLGPLLLLAILVDQIKIEFLRIGFVDYSHFLFCLFGLMLGFAHRELEEQSGRQTSASTISKPAHGRLALGYSQRIKASGEPLGSNLV